MRYQSILVWFNHVKWDLKLLLKHKPTFNVNGTVVIHLQKLGRCYTFTYLQAACLKLNYKLVMALISLGADYNMRDERGNTALMIVHKISEYKRVSSRNRRLMRESIAFKLISITATWRLVEPFAYCLLSHYSKFVSHYTERKVNYTKAYLHIRKDADRIVIGVSPGLSKIAGSMVVDTNFTYVSMRTAILNKRQREDYIKDELRLIDWRPWRHTFYLKYDRQALHTLIVLAKARRSIVEINQKLVFAVNVCGLSLPKTKNKQFMKYPTSCLCLLPEEIIQYLFCYVVDGGTLIEHNLSKLP